MLRDRKEPTNLCYIKFSAEAEDMDFDITFTSLMEAVSTELQHLDLKLVFLL